MATARKLPSGQYRIRVYVGSENGKKIIKSFTAPTKKQAEFMASEYMIHQKTGAVSFSCAMDNYIEAKRNVIAPYSYTTYMSIKKTLLNKYPDFCKKDIFTITQQDVQTIINDMATYLQQKTVRSRHGFIYAVLQYHDVPLRLKTTLPKKEKKIPYIPTDEDVKKLLQLSKGTALEIPIMLAAFGMMRRGEICGLDLKDIDFKTGVITIRNNLVRSYEGDFELTGPKSYEGTRYITVPRFVTDTIKSKGYVCNIRPDTLTTDFTDLVEANMPNRFTFHKLRHYGASIRIFLGIPLSYIQKEGGWGNISVLEDIYAHVFKDKQDEFMKRTVNYFSEMVDTKVDTE